MSNQYPSVKRIQITVYEKIVVNPFFYEFIDTKNNYDIKWFSGVPYRKTIVNWRRRVGDTVNIGDQEYKVALVEDTNNAKEE